MYSPAKIADSPAAIDSSRVVSSSRSTRRGSRANEDILRDGVDLGGVTAGVIDALGIPEEMSSL